MAAPFSQSRMNLRIVSFAFCLSCLLAVKAQCVIPVSIEQYPPLTVTVGEVLAELPDEGLTLGGDMAIEGGDGEYSYLWTNSQGEKISTQPVLFVTAAGDYYLYVTDGRKCSVGVKFSVSAASSVTDIVWDEIGLVRIFDAGGHVVKIIGNVCGSDDVNAHLGGIPQGVYLIGYVYKNGRESVKRFIKK